MFSPAGGASPAMPPAMATALKPARPPTESTFTALIDMASVSGGRGTPPACPGKPTYAGVASPVRRGLVWVRRTAGALACGVLNQSLGQLVLSRKPEVTFGCPI